MKPPALVYDGRRWSPEEASDAVIDRCDALRTSLSESPRVLSFSANPNPDTVWSFFAAMSLGAVALPIPAATTATLRTQYSDASTVRPAEDTRLRLLTSGSTGTPKIVDLTETQLAASAEASQARLGCTSRDIWLCCLPLHHIAGLSILIRTGAAGATTQLFDGFDPDSVNRAIDEDAITMVSLVPTMLQRLLDAREDRPFPTTLRVILLGGAPAQEPLLERCRQISAPVALTWGMSETASQIATRSPGDLRPASDVGLPLPGHRVFVENGRLGVEGPIAPDGRLLTADHGHLDQHGRVVIEGRGDALIISGGENVDPRRVVDVIRSHPSVNDAVVLGLPDSDWGQRVCAVIAGPQERQLDEWLRERLEAHERPRQIVWLDTLPRNAMGKLERADLRALLSDD